MVLGLIVYGIGFFAMTFLAREALIIYIVFACIGALGMYLFMSFGPNYVIDAGEYGYYKTGKDHRTIAINMYNVPVKMGFMIGGTLAGYGLDFIGYKAGMVVTPEFISKFMWVFAGIPGLVAIVGAIVMLIGYKISDEAAAMYAKANAERVARHKAS